jgi:hypothetical protein
MSETLASLGFLPTEGVEIYRGAKPFWRTRNTVDIIIVEHTQFSTLELIVYEPSFDREARRMYLSDAFLSSKVDREAVEAKLKSVKEPILRRREVPDSIKLEKEIINKAKIDYILNRIFVTEFTPQKKVIKAEIQLNFRDRDEEEADTAAGLSLFIEKHANLVPAKSPCIKIL